MNTTIIEKLESRITPATAAMNPITNVLTITGDFVDEDLTIAQDDAGTVEITDNANGGASLGTFQLVRGIIYKGQDANDTVSITIGKAGLAEGLTITDQAGLNSFSVQAGLNAAGSIRKVFNFNGGGGDDTLKLSNLNLSKGLNVTGLGGNDTLEFAANTIAGSVKILTTENITGSNTHMGAVTVDAVGAVGNTDINIVTSTLSGALKITGGAFDDNITVGGSTKSAITIITGNGTNTVVLDSDDGRVAPVVTGGTGDDTVTLSGFWSKGATIGLGNGDNAVTIGADNGLALIGGTLKVTTGTGNDTVTFHSQKVEDAQANPYVLTGSAAIVTLALGAGDNNVLAPNTFRVTGALGITTLGGADTINLNEIKVGGKTSLALGDGTNTTDLTASRLTGGLDYKGGVGDDNLKANVFAEAAITVNAGNGINLIDLAATTTGAINITCGTGADEVTVFGISTSSLTVNLGDGDEQFTLSGLFTTVTIDGGKGIETFTDNGTDADKFTLKNII